MWQILLKKSKIERHRKSRESWFLAVPTAPTLLSADTKVGGRFWVKRCGPSRRRVRNASAVLRNFVRLPKRTFSTLSARTGPPATSAIRSLPGVNRTWLGQPNSVEIDPDVWSGRALQVDFAELAVSGLASMYPAFDWSICPGPSWISARVRSHYRTGLDWAIWVTSVRMRREDRTSISSHPLADLGR